MQMIVNFCVCEWHLVMTLATSKNYAFDQKWKCRHPPIIPCRLREWFGVPTAVPKCKTNSITPPETHMERALH